MGSSMPKLVCSLGDEGCGGTEVVVIGHKRRSARARWGFIGGLVYHEVIERAGSV